MTREQFTFCVANCQEPLRRFLTALCCGDTMLADDLAQEALLKAYTSLAQLANPERFKPWVFSIAHRVFLDHQRSSRPRAELPANAEAPEADAFRYQALYQALARLSERERSALLLFYMQGYSIKEISHITETTEAAVKQMLMRGRQHLKHLLPYDERNSQ